MMSAPLLIALLAAWSDHRTQKIPDWLTLPAIGFALIAGNPFAAILIPLAFFYILNPDHVGGGDTKLSIALSGMLGFTWAFVAGAIAIAMFECQPRIEKRMGIPILVGVTLTTILKCLFDLNAI